MREDRSKTSRISKIKHNSKNKTRETVGQNIGNSQSTIITEVMKIVMRPKSRNSKKKQKGGVFDENKTWVLDPARGIWRLGATESETKKPLGNKKAKTHPTRTPIATAVRTRDLRRELVLLFLIKGPSLSLRPIIVSPKRDSCCVLYLFGVKGKQ